MITGLLWTVSTPEPHFGNLVYCGSSYPRSLTFAWWAGPSGCRQLGIATKPCEG